MNAPWTVLSSHAALLQRDDVDTDQIIPARFLTTTTRQGLGRHLFADWRYAADGTPRPDFVLNRPSAEGAKILVAGRNFGCGSSREHAPWALTDWGIRAVVAGSFADIFRSNAHKNGLLTVQLEAGVLTALHEALRAGQGGGGASGSVITVDLPAQRITFAVPAGGVEAPGARGGAAPPTLAVGFDIDAFGKRCLVEGLDELGALIAELPTIEAWEVACGR